MDGADPNLLTSSYYYADAQVVCQRQHDPAEPETYDSSWYVHDRLGSVRLVVVPVEEPGGLVVRAFNSYTYTPFGQFQEGQCVEHIANPWKFTGQWHDVEIDQYHLRARQYDPTMMRFTSRDPIVGDRQEPLTLHKYLYCLNNPINMTDSNGQAALQIAKGLRVATTVYAAGLTIASYGGDYGNFDLIALGAGITQLSGLGFAIGMAGVCFIEGTEILTPVGSVPIEQIEPGWHVWGANPENGNPGIYEVVQCYKRQTDGLVIITIGDEIIKTTYEHPFFVYEQGWRQAGNLTAGTYLVDFNGKPVEIDNIEVVLMPAMVYNFEVAEAHTYYVSGKQLLVHNRCSRQLSPNQLNEAIRRGQAPKDLERIDKVLRSTDKLHAHFKNGSALNIDGTWRHGSGPISKDALKWLIEYGSWMAPK